MEIIYAILIWFGLMDDMNHEYLPVPRNGEIVCVWEGGTRISYNDLYFTMQDIVESFPESINDERGIINLLLETASTETEFGYYIQEINGYALGIFQITKTTHDSIFDHYLKYNKHLLEWVMTYYDINLSTKDNLRYNIKYQVAISLVILSNRNVLDKDLSLEWERAIIYKRKWNTSAGSATPELYIENKKFLRKMIEKA